MKFKKSQLKQIIKEEIEAIMSEGWRDRFTHADPGGMDYTLSAHGDTAGRRMKRWMASNDYTEEQIERASKLRYNNPLDLRMREIDDWYQYSSTQGWTPEQIIYFIENAGKYLPDGITAEKWEEWKAVWTA